MCVRASVEGFAYVAGGVRGGIHPRASNIDLTVRAIYESLMGALEYQSCTLFPADSEIHKKDRYSLLSLTSSSSSSIITVRKQGFAYVLDILFRNIVILMLIKVQLDATVCRHLFTATSLYMFRVSRTHHQEY